MIVCVLTFLASLRVTAAAAGFLGETETEAEAEAKAEAEAEKEAVKEV